MPQDTEAFGGQSYADVIHGRKTVPYIDCDLILSNNER